jgi:lipopolysaccharide transport system permease protein
MVRDIKELFKYRYLLWIWTLREIRIRYKQSLLGGAWAVLQPLSLMIILTIVFSYIARVPTDGIPYPVFSYAGLLMWTLLATSVTFAIPSLVRNMNLVTKIYFPREILPLASIGAAIVDFSVASIIFFVLLAIYRIPITWTFLWVPLILVIQVTLILGVTLMASAINVFYRDIRFIVPLAVQLWFYATPIIYPVSLVPEEVRVVFMLNPAAGIVESYRRVVLHGISPDPFHLGVAAGLAVVLCFVSYLVFKRLEPQFADII